jgi:hypothetical protein
MLMAEAHIPTDQASRYLTQLCQHACKMGQHLSGGLSRHAAHVRQPVLHVDCSDTIGAIRFSDGQCILWATDGALLLSVGAPTENALRRLQNGITHRRETFGYRAHLTVCWQPSLYGPTCQLDDVPGPTPAPVAPMTVQRRWRLGRNLVLAAAAPSPSLLTWESSARCSRLPRGLNGAPVPSSRSLR